MADSIYPITQLYFRCQGCGARWMLRPDPPLGGAGEFRAFMGDPARVESCPRECGSRTVDVAFRLPGPPGDPGADPFDVFRGKP